jgi:YegS/Rv2252/BmrU family lipid kinase
MRTRIGVVINPISGAGAHRDAGRARVEIARTVLARLGCVPDVRVTERAGHARDLVRALVDAGASRVVAWGGDGTVNEVAATLVPAGVPLGIVPSGSGNGLATELGLSTQPDAAFERAVRADARSIDAGELNGRLFFNLAGIGFDAQIAHEFHNLPAGRRGGLPYLTIGLRAIHRYRAQRYRVRVDGGEPFEHTALLVVFANARQYGNGAIIAPRAQPDDGRLDVVVVDDRSFFGHVRRLPHLFRGTADCAPGVTTCRAATATIECDAPLVMHVDGEPVPPAARADVRVLPGALRVAF